jgi:hypothetical protein
MLLSDLDLEAKLKGTTLRVYWHLVRTGNATSARGLQRGLHLSSPSVAVYHLDKLIHLGLVRKNSSGDYEVKETVSLGTLRSFVRISGLMIPRYLFYAALFLTLLLVFTLRYLQPLSLQGVFALIFGLCGVIIMAYEAVRQWRLKPV